MSQVTTEPPSSLTIFLNTTLQAAALPMTVAAEQTLLVLRGDAFRQVGAPTLQVLQMEAVEDSHLRPALEACPEQPVQRCPQGFAAFPADQCETATVQPRALQGSPWGQAEAGLLPRPHLRLSCSMRESRAQAPPLENLV